MPGKRRLLLLRHAKADRSDPAIRDFDRPLTPRGLRSAESVGRYLAGRGTRLDLVICSPAVRARETFGLVQSLLPRRLEIDICDDLYLAGPTDLLARLAKTPSEQRSVLMVGHNPGFEELISVVCDGGKSQALERLAEGFKTAALAEIELTIEDWARVSPGSGKLLRITRPRDLE